jgi:hypothetical protein
MGTGIVGSITGIAGAIMGYVSYKKSNQIKTLDLRIELKRAVENTIFEFKKLREQMQEGNKSRKAVAAAMGTFKSSVMDIWKKEFEIDQTSVKELANELPEEDTNYDHLDPKGLEAKLIELHRTQKKIQKLSEKYSEAMARDDEQRKQLREDMRARSRS